LGEIIRNRDANGRIVKWPIELGEFEIKFCPRQAIKSQILVDFVSEWTEIQMPFPRSGLNTESCTLTAPSTSKEQAQACYSSLPRESSSSMSCRFITKPPNNGVEYEALIHRLRIIVPLASSDY
jgi:hypothetical protein